MIWRLPASTATILARLWSRALASVLTPRERMGRIGAERLLARIRGETVTPKMLDLGFTLSPGDLFKLTSLK
ncbi:Gluconate utilization system GNT-I transcriptional repressor [Raoultella terrigena]|uniref:Gluconate utilization system GNT-I transcriptional repressor n=1 Tax=Raoultella terrigena TaxID=577 RepID=A0A4U9D3N0_RAOTE|nr:Gluconate utilization system GNT-I transcriptional repressor [Raoultella terrigena]